MITAYYEITNNSFVHAAVEMTVVNKRSILSPRINIYYLQLHLHKIPTFSFLCIYIEFAIQIKYTIYWQFDRSIMAAATGRSRGYHHHRTSTRDWNSASPFTT